MSNEILKALLAQEQELQFRQFNNDTAWLLGDSLKQAAERIPAAVTIEVYAFEQVIFSFSMARTTKDNQDWARRKRQSVMRFGHSSYYLGRYNAAKKRDFEMQAHLDASEYAAHGGSFPIRIKNCGLIGAVTVSGLPQVEDHNLVVEAIKYLVEAQYAQSASKI